MRTLEKVIPYTTFGDFLSAKRREKGIPSTQVTDALCISPGYYCDIEKNRRNPPDKATLEKIVRVLYLNPADIDMFYDLAGKEHHHERKILKCPSCSNRLTDMSIDTKVELYQHPARLKVNCQFIMRCMACQCEVGINIKAA